MLIEPVAFEHEGYEVDSSDDMLTKIKELNNRLKNSTEINASSFEDTRDTVEIDDDKSLNDKKIYESPKKVYPTGDIRNFGVKGRPTNDKSKSAIKKRLKEKIDLLRFKRKGDTLLPDLPERYVAS